MREKEMMRTGLRVDLDDTMSKISAKMKEVSGSISLDKRFNTNHNL